MRSMESDGRGLGAGFPGPVARALVYLVVPRDRREEFEGDLIEEAETIVLPETCRRTALRWFWWQLAISAPPMLARRFAKEVAMHPRRWIIPAALVFIWGVLGLLDQRNASYAGFDWSRSAVLRIDAGSPAERAGLRVGDRVVKVDGIPVDNLRALQQQSRAAIGEVRTLEVERTDATTGVTATENIALTYGQQPVGDAVRGVVIGVVGVVFLLSGMTAYLTAPSTTTFLFAVVGLCFGISLLPGPYIPAAASRTFVSFASFLASLVGFATLLHLMLVFPRPKDVIERRWTRHFLYLPVVVVLLIGIPVLTAGPSTGRPGVSLAIVNGLVLLAYAVLSVLALIHSYVKASATERRSQGLNVLLAGLVVGLLPIGASVVVGLFVRVDLLPGADYVPLTLVLIPAAVALALVKGAGKASEQPAAGAV